MKSEKIGIITFHRSYNYGSVLQAYALQNFLAEHGYTVKIIDYEQRNNFEQFKLFRWNSYKIKPYLFGADMLYLFSNLRRKKIFDNFKRNRLYLTSKRYYDNSDMTELNDEFDTFICGSDQIWNIDCTKGIVPAFYLEFVNKKNKKIAYAPSLAHTDFLPEYFDANHIRRALKDFHAISLRERSTIGFFQQFTNTKIEYAMDPVLFLKQDDLKKLIMVPANRRKKYIFLYMLEKKDERLIVYCNKLYKKYGYEVIYISKSRYWNLKNGKKVYGCSAEEFLGYIKNAVFVVTNSFHATVFSVIFKCKFHTFTTPRSYARMQDFLTDLGLEDRIYENGFQISQEINYNEVEKKLRIIRKNSERYLLTALEDD